MGTDTLIEEDATALIFAFLVLFDTIVPREEQDKYPCLSIHFDYVVRVKLQYHDYQD